MADAMITNRWMRSLLMALRGSLDSFEYAIGAGDRDGAAMLLAVADGFVREPWHPFMAGVPGWIEEVERYRSLSAASNVPPAAHDDDLQAWIETYWDSADRQVSTDMRLERRRAREVGR